MSGLAAGAQSQATRTASGSSNATTPYSPERSASSSSAAAEHFSPGITIERRTGGRISGAGSRVATSGGGVSSLGAIGAHRTGSPVSRLADDAGSSLMGGYGSTAFRPSSLRSSSPSFSSAVSQLQINDAAPQRHDTPKLVFQEDGGEPQEANVEAASLTPRVGSESARQLFEGGAGAGGRRSPAMIAPTATTASPQLVDDASLELRGASMVGQLVGDDDDEEHSLSLERDNRSQMPRSESGNTTLSVGGGSAYPFPINGGASFPQAPGSTSGRSAQGPTPYLSLPQQSGAASHALAGGLLSPTAAAFGGASQAGPSSTVATPGGGASTAAFSPFGSPPHARPTTSSSSVHSASFGGMQNVRGGIMDNNSPSRPMVNRATSADDNSAFGGSEAAERRSAAAGAPASALDASLRSSPLFNDMLDRLIRLEMGLKDVNRHIGGLSRNVSLLLERTKHFPAPAAGSVAAQSGFSAPRGAGAGQGQYSGADVHAAALGAGQAQEDVKVLGAQLSSLAGSVAQILAMQQNQQGGSGAAGGPQAGGNVGTPQLGMYAGTPNLGATINRAGALSPFDRASSPRVGSGFGSHSMHQLGADSRLSPRPGATASNRLSWGAGPPAQQQGHLAGGPRSSFSPAPRHDGFGVSSLNMRTRTPDIEAASRFGAGPAGAMGPPDPSVVVTKWEHLNLHMDLLRSILKYGLGPPNKIQQRALPFLLRGSDIIAQAPPTQERIASYVIPALQQILNVLRGEPIAPGSGEQRGPIAMIISTTVDQATQAQRMALGLGSALGVRVHIAAAGSIDVSQEAANLIQAQPHLVVGTPQKMNDLFTYLANRAGGAVNLSDVRLVILDEVDQLIARNLADYVSTLLRILPQPRATSGGSARSPTSPGLPQSSGPQPPFSPFDDGNTSNAAAGGPPAKPTLDRQTAIFSNTVPQDVLNFAQSIHLRESVRVLVRREAGGALQTLTHAGYGASGFQGGAGGAHAAASSPSIGSGTMGLGNNHHPTPTSQFIPQGAMQPYGNPGAGNGSAVQPPNALGATPANSNANPLADPVLAALRGMRQYFLYVSTQSPTPQMGFNGPNAHANEMKLDVITDLLEDIEFGQAVIYTASAAATEAVTYKLASKGIDALAMNKDMASTTRHAVMSKFRSASTPASAFQQASQMVVGGPGGANGAQGGRKALVVNDLAVNPRDVHQVPLVVFYDLPRSVEEYKEKISCAAAGSLGRPSVCVNVVTGSGGPRGDIEMLRVIEHYLGCKMAELPMHPGQILNF